jgi:hypothetical protein
MFATSSVIVIFMGDEGTRTYDPPGNCCHVSGDARNRGNARRDTLAQVRRHHRRTQRTHVAIDRRVGIELDLIRINLIKRRVSSRDLPPA